MSKDDERKVQTSETLIQVAIIRLLVARLIRSAYLFPDKQLQDKVEPVYVRQGQEAHIRRFPPKTAYLVRQRPPVSK